MEMAKRGQASCCPDSGHLCLNEEEELAAFAMDCQAPHFFPVILTLQCILMPMYPGGSGWIFLDPHPNASLQRETRICTGPAENEDSPIGAIICAVPENPSGTEGGSGVCKTSVVGTRLVDTG